MGQPVKPLTVEVLAGNLTQSSRYLQLMCWLPNVERDEPGRTLRAPAEIQQALHANRGQDPSEG
jgi:hypothetical protein